jgi:hypothetical protein
MCRRHRLTGGGVVKTALMLRFRKKTQQTVMAGLDRLDPAIYESQVDAVPARGCPAQEPVLGPREARTRGPGMTTEATSESSECI